ncbi:MAG TPA: Gfo/Idh/MocA family oxidoreductase [Anaerolineales bacterium]|nr:Gfo/Idh/MocA family oxidoreductase [Anaerolineales bacterium]
MTKTVKVGIVGTGFVGDIHHTSFKNWVRDAEVIAVASPHNADKFAEERGIPVAYADYRQMLQDKDIDVIDIGIPNDLHYQVVVDAAKAGKHVIIEKPLCITLEQADEMIETCQKAGVLLMYAEELLFAPKYVRVKTLIEEGAIGEPFLAKQSEEHPGPHMPWFWDVNRSGGGVLLDMGCHSIEYTRWILGKPRVKSVTAFMGTYLHQERTQGEDHSFTIVEYEGGKIAMLENSWAKGGGVDDRCEVYGKKGHTRADLLRGSSLLTYSEEGYGYAVEKAGTTRGYTFTMFEEIWNYGFPQEMQHFVNCVLGKETCLETGEDGREVLKIMYAAYQSAGEGRKIEWPYNPSKVSKPIDLWKK